MKRARLADALHAPIRTMTLSGALTSQLLSTPQWGTREHASLVSCEMRSWLALLSVDVEFDFHKRMSR